MKNKIQYTDQADRESVLLANQDKFLVEEQNVQEGNYLIFDDTKPTEVQLKELQQNILVLMDAVATAFEEILALRQDVTGGGAA